MNFGVRLGPFRASVNNKGKVYGGVTAGPFSVSAPLGGGKSQAGPAARVLRCNLDQAIQLAQQQGCKLVRRGPYGATIKRGIWESHLRPVRGGVQVVPSWSTAQVLIALAVVAGLLVLCFGLVAATS